MANVYRRGSIWWGRAQRNGKDLRKSLKTSDKAEAKRRLRKCVDEIDRAIWRESIEPNPHVVHLGALGRGSKDQKRGGVPERCKTARVAQITGLSEYEIETMAANGQIPGAAKLGEVWTFSETRIRRWVRDQETTVARRTETARPPDDSPVLD